jgi:hypothetical protein
MILGRSADIPTTSNIFIAVFHISNKLAFSLFHLVKLCVAGHSGRAV